MLQDRHDPDQVRQMLTNLCVNARDAIVGTGKINITTQNVSFDETCCENYPEIRTGDYVCLAVSDSGSGMDETTKKHIFDPFFTTKAISKGTGLSTVYGIAKQNNAFINVYSEINEGTTFKIFIPRYQKSIPTARPNRSEESIKLNKETILLVEDEPSLLQVSKNLLEELGCLVIVTGGPAEAIERASDQSTQIDLLLTDVVMPDMNGRELATCIQELRPGIKCLFMSGYTADIIATRGVLDTGINFIQKPFSTASLAQKLREVLAHV
jgi:CheY-like chemotaxis protein